MIDIIILEQRPRRIYSSRTAAVVSHRIYCIWTYTVIFVHLMVLRELHGDFDAFVFTHYNETILIIM